MHVEQVVGLHSPPQGRPKRTRKAHPCGIGGHKARHKAGPTQCEEPNQGDADPLPHIPDTIQDSISVKCHRVSTPSAYKWCSITFLNDLPLVGNIAPDFEAEAVFDQEFIKVKLSEYIGKKYVVLFFYPLDFTFVCPTEITAFSDRHAVFEQLNTQILGVSVDSVVNRKSGGLGDLKYPLISDVTKSISKSYGVLIPDQV
ncbi:hypothetical protein ACB098_03G093800 [Castanea mollissima]